MSAAWVWIPSILFSSLMLHSAVAQSQMCEEPFQAALMVVNNVAFPASSSFLDSDLVFYREVLRFTEEEIDRERETAMNFYRDFYGLDFTNVQPDELGRRILGNATFRPVMFPYNNTFVFNSWLVDGRAKTRCFRVGDGGFEARFSGTVMLHSEYGGEEGTMGFANEGVFYGQDYFFDVCAQQGIIFQLETPTPIRLASSDGWFVFNFRVRNRMLGEGVAWGVGRVTAADQAMLRYESRQVYTFL